MNHNQRHRRFAVVPGADIEQPPVEKEDGSDSADERSSTDSSSTTTSGPTADSSGGLSTTRGKKNEIDFTIAPADVSLSRAYGISTSSAAAAVKVTLPPESTTATTAATPPPTTSLTLALNNASNRAVRRILLSRAWPSAEALNQSLRQVAQAERKLQQAQQQSTTAKCPVPRPILNVLTRKRDHISSPTPSNASTSSQRTDQEYVADQLRSFRQRYAAFVPNYDEAEDYLAAVLSLATSGTEEVSGSDDKATAVATRLASIDHAYHGAYKRLLGVLRSAGVVWETDAATGHRKIANRLSNQDICLSMLDRIRQQKQQQGDHPHSLTETVVDDNTKRDEKEKKEKVAAVTNSSTNESSDPPQHKSTVPEEDSDVNATSGNNVLKSGPFKIFRRRKGNQNQEHHVDDSQKDKASENSIKKDDLGGILLSAQEPSMTGQLNRLSNVVLRALLFGGDQELLVLAETLDADRAAFVDRWYPQTGKLLNDADVDKEHRPGVQYLNCLVDLLRRCYENGVVVDLQPNLPLSQSYANAYERLVGMAVELGSGYLKPVPSAAQSLPKPRTAKEELGRLALWESRFRQSGTPDTSPYPEDMEGIWEVRDEFGGETIGSTMVTLGESGEVTVKPPVEGLRWRLDPGPTHLDTCTFQVLNTDGTILQYRGFIDRGARLEARFSKRPMRIRGSVMFQMRDGSVDYYKDILPINYREGTTKFVMKKVSD